MMESFSRHRCGHENHFHDTRETLSAHLNAEHRTSFCIAEKFALQSDRTMATRVNDTAKMTSQAVVM
jgi:hypothetical protein